LCGAFRARDGDEVEALLLDLARRARVGRSMLAWASTLAAANSGQEVVDLLPHPQPEVAGHLARLIDAAAAGLDGTRAGVVEQLTARSDAEVWLLSWHLAEAVYLWTANIGGIAHWQRLLVAHNRAVVVAADRETLAGPAAAVIGLVSVGQFGLGHERLGWIIGGGDGNLAGVLQMWLQLCLTWLDGSRAMMAMDRSGMPQAMVDPHHGGGYDGDGIDRVHLLHLVGTLIDTVRDGDLTGVQTVTQPITALRRPERMALAWQLAMSLGVHASRWLLPADPGPQH